MYYLTIIIILKLYYLLKLDDFKNRGYLLLFLLETTFNAYAIYYIISSLFKFYDLYSPFNQEWTYIYIWIICTLQLLFFLTTIILFLIRYMYIQLLFLSKFKFLFTFLNIIIILFNFSSLNELNGDKYSFQIQNFEIKRLSNYEKYFKNYYLNIYLNKEADFNEYELCFEVEYHYNFTEVFNKELSFSKWKIEQKKDTFMGCKNISFDNNKTIDKDNPLTLFKCDTTSKNNILPNYCVPAEHRRKKYDFIYTLNIFEIILLIVVFIFIRLSGHIFYKYQLFTMSKEYIDDDDEGGENEEEEGEEDEGVEEDDEEEEEEQEEVEEKINYRRYRKISKKKKKYYKKKNRFRRYNNNNDSHGINAISKEEDIKDDEQNKNGKEKNIENKINNENIDKNYGKNPIEDNKKEKEDCNINKEDKLKEDGEKKSIENKKKEEEKEENSFEYIRSYKRNSFISYLFFGSFADKIKNKFYNILKEIDKDIKENEQN